MKSIRYIAVGIIGICIGVAIGFGVSTYREKSHIQEVSKQEEVNRIEEKEDKVVMDDGGLTPSQPENEVDPYINSKIYGIAMKKKYLKERAEALEEYNNRIKEYNEQLIKEYKEDPFSYLYQGEGKLITYDYMEWNTDVCKLARNEIYAKHGYIFETEEYKNVFGKKNWYTPITHDMNLIELSDDEIYNVTCLKWWEENNYKFEYSDVEKGFMDCYSFKMNQTFTMDLNGDGIQEEISFKGVTDEYDLTETGTVQINGKTQATVNGNLEPYIWVVDVDPRDDYKELVIYDEGPSDDPVDSYFYYDGKTLRLMGEVEGHINTYDYIDDGILHAVRRSDILGTRRYKWDYQLTADHIWEEVGNEYISIKIPIIAQEKINVYKEQDEESSFRTYPSGTSFMTLGTDLERWVNVRLADGSEGWINIEEYQSYDFGGIVFFD